VCVVDLHSLSLAVYYYYVRLTAFFLDNLSRPTPER